MIFLSYFGTTLGMCYILYFLFYFRTLVGYSILAFCLERVQCVDCQILNNKATLLLDCYTHYKVVITIWLTVSKYPNLKWQWIFYFLRICFLSSITATTFTGLARIYEYTARSYEKQELLILPEHMSLSPVVCGIRIADNFMLFFVLSYYVSLRS